MNCKTKFKYIIPSKGTYDYRKLISNINDLHEEEIYQAKSVQLGLQCHWTKWCDYIKNDLSWKTLLSQPNCITSFCIGSTYNTLPSPSNLVRWGLEKDSSCYLCNNKVCTIPHILGSCKIALAQGRFTYRHDSILYELLKSIKHFLSSYTRKAGNDKTTIKFVSAGYQKSDSKKSPNIGLLNFASDWQVLSDLDSLVIPPYLAITQLRPDVLIISKSTFTVIILELTCPCEENMESWHITKTDKYSNLCNEIKSNGWSVHFFAVEVGARGYCSETTRFCLKRLGFQNKLSRSTLKSLSQTSIRASFYIWLARNHKEWNKSDSNITFANFKSGCSPSSSLRNLNTVSKPSTSAKIEEPKQTTLNNGIINKGNTCYVNVIIQSLNVLSRFCQSLSNCNSSKSPLVSATLTLFKLLKTSKVPVDPSSFLVILKNVISKAKGTMFDIFTQQDAPEILEYILLEFSLNSVFISAMFEIAIITTVTCKVCYQEEKTEEVSSILRLDLSASIQKAIEQFSKAEELSDSQFCHFCSCVQPKIQEKMFRKCGNFVIIQLNRFGQQNGIIRKDTSFAEVFSESITLSLQLDSEIFFRKQLSLKAVINHIGSLYMFSVRSKRKQMISL